MDKCLCKDQSLYNMKHDFNLLQLNLTWLLTKNVYTSQDYWFKTYFHHRLTKYMQGLYPITIFYFNMATLSEDFITLLQHTFPFLNNTETFIGLPIHYIFRNMLEYICFNIGSVSVWSALHYIWHSFDYIQAFHALFSR